NIETGSPRMRIVRIAAVTAVACCATTLAAAGPFDALKGKMKPGMYEDKIDVDMGQVQGMPPGMGKPSQPTQHCVTQEDIDKGQAAKGPREPGKGGCEIKNMNMSGNTATYTMECPNMKGDARMTFTGDGYKMDMKTSVVQGNQTMNMTQHMEAKYLGACK